MQHPIDQLEDRVDRAVAQLRRLAGERDGLEAEVRQLSERLERHAAAGSEVAPTVGEGVHLEDRQALVAGLRRALDELRAE